MADTMQDRIAVVRERIAKACSSSGRNPSEVRIVAVAKTFGPEAVREAADCGLTVMGENKVQEAAHKIPECPGHLEWHMVGHLQTNKVKTAVQIFRMIHSVDSLRLLQAVDSACDLAGVRMPVLLEINVSGEASKFGLAPDAVAAVLEAGMSLANVEIAGLMTVPPFTEDPAESRPFFASLRDLRERYRAESGVLLTELSMGMSHDFEYAVAEGATMLRLGTVIFGNRPKKAPQSE